MSKLSSWRNNNSWIANEDIKNHYLPRVPSSSQNTWLGEGYINITSSLHVLHNMGYTNFILIIYGYSYHTVVFQGINWFSCLQIYICPKYFYREQYLSTWGTLLRRKTICWYVDIEGMLGILPGGSITTFWFAVDLALFVHGWKLNWKM